MTQISLHSDFIKNGYTLIDNVFLSSYLPQADAIDCKVYLYGLYLLSSQATKEATIENIALDLRLTIERVRDAFLYWEDEGLVTMTRTAPICLLYMSVKYPLPKAFRFDTAKYAGFIEEVTRLFPDRIISQNELSRYQELLHFKGLEPNALLMIMQYCKNLKGANVGAQYIMAVAEDWIKDGYLTEEKVNEHIDELEKNSDSVRQILSALGLKSQPDLNARELFVKWCSWGFDLYSILTVAKLLKKRGGFTKLDKTMNELYNEKAFSSEEIKEYWSARNMRFNLASDIVKNIGAFYGSLDPVVETYVSPWLSKGYTEQGLIRISKLCFISGIKTLEGVNDRIDRLYKQGIVSDEAIEQYVQNRVETDREIKNLFELAGIARQILPSDREYYNIWTVQWAIPLQLIRIASEMAKGHSFGINKINTMLLSIKGRADIDIESARQSFSKALGNDKNTKKQKPMLTHSDNETVVVFDPDTEV